MMYLIILFPFISFAHIVQDDVSLTEKSRFSFKTVCSEMVSHETPLIDAVSGTELDCMGKKIQVGQFCEKKMAADPYYLRAYLDRESKEPVCVSGKKYSLSISA